MPLDFATPRHSNRLAQTPPDRPLTVEEVKAIVREGYQGGYLIASHLTIRSFGYIPDVMVWDGTEYFSPHGYVDATLGTDQRESCPCTASGPARTYLEKLNTAHLNMSVLASRKGRENARLKFEKMLEG